MTPSDSRFPRDVAPIGACCSVFSTRSTADALEDIVEGTVIVFANDSARWQSARFVRSARPDQEGRWQIKGLPDGEYLAVAVDYVEDGRWNDPEYLESIRRYGQKVRLAEAVSEPIALKLVIP